MVLRKDELEASLREEKALIESGKLKEDSPLDNSEPFRRLCVACRLGDLKVCQEAINDGANINARDAFDYTPLILASLCGRYEVVQLLLESGALCERDTFQGERCLYNALNDRIRNLLLAYDYSKSSDPLQPLASHISSLLTREHPKTSDIVVTSADRSFNLHKFVLAARSPYFRNKLSNAPETTHWKLPATFPPKAFEIAIRYVYLGELPNDVGSSFGFSEDDNLKGIEKISKHLEIPSLWDGILEISDKRLARQYRTDELQRARAQLETWFMENVVRHHITVDMAKADEVKWDRENGIYADVLLRADEVPPEDLPPPSGTQTPSAGSAGFIPIGPLSLASAPEKDTSATKDRPKSTLFPAHRAMLLRSEYFNAMFSSSFLEAQESPYLRIIPTDCAPDVLQEVLKFIYTEKAEFSLDIAVDVLYAADHLLMDTLKAKAAQIINSLGNGTLLPDARPAEEATNGEGSDNTAVTGPDGDSANAESNPLDPLTILRAAWLLRVPRLEEFAARYLAYRLEQYIDLPEFIEAVAESAARIRNRQETDSIELIDDIRYFLSERFRLRFEADGLEEMLDEDMAAEEAAAEAAAASVGGTVGVNGNDVAPKGIGIEQGTQDTVKREQPVANGSDKSPPQAAEEQSRQKHNLPAEAEAIPSTSVPTVLGGEFRTLDGEAAGDEFESDAMNYQILLGKIDALLDKLHLEG